MTALQPVSRPVTGAVDLVAAQLEALTLWHAARHATEMSLTRAGLSREARLDAARRLDVRRREHEVIVERTQLALTDAGEPLPQALAPRAVIGHRHAWTRDKLSSELRSRGTAVLAATDNGADVVGVCVAEQPSLVVLDELLAMRSGLEVVAEVRQLCPHTRLAAYVTSDRAVGALLDAGADVVLTRRVPPGEVADRMLELVHG